MFSFLCQWFDCFGFDSRESGPEVQGKGKAVAVECVCVCVAMSLCKCHVYFSSVRDVMEILGCGRQM